MKKHDIKVGGLYTARISGNFVTVRVDAIREGTIYNRDCTLYDVTNLTTKRTTTFRSAAKFRGEVKPQADKPRGRQMTREELGLAMPSESKQTPVACECVEEMPDGRPVEEKNTFTDNNGETPTLLEPPGNRGPHDQGEVKELLPDMAKQEGEQRSDPTSVPSVGSVEPKPTQPQPDGNVPPTQITEAPTTTDPAPTSMLAAKIAAQVAPVATGLTQQQQDILAAARKIEAARDNGQRVLVIGAGAGTGKTHTLRQLEQVLQGNGQYTAFNSSLVAESKAKFKRAACNTTHSLAFRAVGCQFKHRLGGARVKSWEVANRLGIKDYIVELPEAIAPHDDGKPQVRTLKAAYLAGQVVGAIKRFCQSADAELTAKHFQRFDGLDQAGEHTNSNRVKDYLLPFATAMWVDLTNKDGTLPFSHDVYVKIWEMGQGNDRPVIAADYILLDEAQDTAEVMLSILQQQKHALLILVGDDNQSIYQWRGAINAMASFPDAPRHLLSQSFRFGQAVADVANAILGTLEIPTDLVMQGLPSIPSRVHQLCPITNPRCYLYRTNAGAIGKLMNVMDEGKRGHLIGGTQEVVSFCRAALDLQARKGTTHPELGCFTSWGEVQAYVKEDEGADLKLMVKLIDDFGANRIIKALDNMPPEDKADLVISTAHKSKGREWASVRLGQDFKTANKLDDAERRLLYVAATRAQEELDLTQCPPFCGGTDKKGGEDGDNGGTEWIPGLEIVYTAQMPTTDQLSAYRAQKSAPECPKIAQDSLAGQIPAQPTQDAAPPAPGTANGKAAAIANGENIWTKGKYGNWVVRGRPGQAGTVKVTRKNGTASQETIKRVIWQDETVALYEV